MLGRVQDESGDMCLVQVAQRCKVLTVTCKTSSDFVEHTECCEIAKSVWDADLCPVSLRSSVGMIRKVTIHEDAPVEPAEFVVPSKQPLNTLIFSSFVERLKVVVDTTNSRYALRPLGCTGLHSTDNVFRKATVWGPTSAAAVNVYAGVTGEEYGIFPVNPTNFVDMSIMYDWWSLTQKSGMRLHCMYEHLSERYKQCAQVKRGPASGPSCNFLPQPTPSACPQYTHTNTHLTLSYPPCNIYTPFLSEPLCNMPTPFLLQFPPPIHWTTFHN